MGKKNFDDEDDGRPLRKKKPKHSKNVPGKGMRVINSYDEEDIDDPFLDELGIEDQIFISISHTKSR